MSGDEASRRLWEAAVLELRKLVDAHCAGLPPVMREAMELTAVLSLAEWAAARAGAQSPEAGEEERAP